jgi:hypothetical protein
MSRNLVLASMVAAFAAAGLGGCIHVHIDPIEVAPINIYAKLDADLRVKLDDDVKSLAQKNPDLF